MRRSNRFALVSLAGGSLGNARAARDPGLGALAPSHGDEEGTVAPDGAAKALLNRRWPTVSAKRMNKSVKQLLSHLLELIASDTHISYLVKKGEPIDIY